MEGRRGRRPLFSPSSILTFTEILLYYFKNHTYGGNQMKKIAISFISILILSTCTFAQPTLSWTQTYGGDDSEKGYSIQQTSDEGYIIAGYTDSYGAGDADVYLIKTDAQGDTLWTKTYGGILDDEGYCVQQTIDGGYIVAGETESYGAGDYDFWLIKTDASGDTAWTRTFGGWDHDRGRSVQQTSDGGYIITGMTDSYGAGGPTDAWLIKTDTLGIEQWNHTYGGTGSDRGYSVQQTSDGGYIVAGWTNSFGNGTQVYSIKTDASGIAEWSQSYGGGLLELGYSVQQTSDGGYVFVGQTTSFGAGYYDVYLIKTDGLGIQQWSQTFGGWHYDAGYSVQQTNDGGYIITGKTLSFGSGDDDLYIIKTGSTGAEEWTRILGGSYDDEGLNVQNTSDGGYIVVGYTRFDGAPSNDVYLIKLGPTTGIISGIITDSLTLDPVPDVKVLAYNVYMDPVQTDPNGLYIIPEVQPGHGYEVTAFKDGYETKTIRNVTVMVGLTTAVDFDLVPVEEQFIVAPLEPDPNPLLSTIEQGGTLWRHYQILDDSTMSPRADIEIWVNDGEYVPEPSDLDGIVSIEIPSSDIGNGSVGETETFTITNLDGDSIPAAERIEFDCEVTDRQYYRAWANEKNVKVGVSIVKTEITQGSEVELQECGNSAIIGDSLFIKRQGRDYVGVGWDVMTPVKATIGPVSAGATAGGQVGVGVLTNDAYKFDYQIIGDVEAVAQYILFANGNYHLIDNTLIALLAYFETWFTSQSTLDNAYRYDSKAIDVAASGEALVPIGYLNNQFSTSMGAGTNIGANGHVILGYQCFDQVPENRVSGSVTGAISASTSGGINFGSAYWSNPNTYELPEILNFTGAAGGSIGAELATVWNRNMNIWQRFEFNFNWSYYLGSTGVDKSTSYVMEGPGVYETLNQVAQLGSALNGVYQHGASTAIYSTTFDQFLYNGFQALGSLQELATDPPLISYEVIEGEISDVSNFGIDIEVSASGERTFSGQVGAGTAFKRFDRKVSKRGAWVRGNHLDLEVYEDNPQVNTEYSEVVDRIIDSTPWYVRAAAFTINMFSFLFVEDWTFDLGNGSSIYFSDNSVPQTLDSLMVASWGWWGSNPATLSSDIDERDRNIRARLRDDAESIYGMKYGIGGFYQIEPLGTDLLDSVSLTIAYQESEVVGLDESTLKMYWEDKENHRWQLVGGVVDIVNNTVTAEIETLQVYTLAPTMPSGAFSLIPNPPAIPADSMTVCTVTSSIIMNNDETVVEDGTVFTVSSTTGQITTEDADTTEAGIQVETLNGIIEFEMIAWSIAYDATVRAISFYGTAEADTIVDFTDNLTPGTPTLEDLNNQNKSIDVLWSSNSECDLAGYNIYYDTDESGPPYTGIGTIFGQPSPVQVGLDTIRTLIGLSNDSTYYVAVTAFDISGNESNFSNELTTTPLVVPEDETETVLPTVYSLDQNYPNPFNPYTTIQFGLPEANWVEIGLYNILGQRVMQLVNSYRQAGHHKVTFDASKLASGIYFYRIEAGEFVKSHKMVLLK
jgi:carboxypeptidase family protein/type IX secretion system substrate protein